VLLGYQDELITHSYNGPTNILVVRPNKVSRVLHVGYTKTYIRPIIILSSWSEFYQIYSCKWSIYSVVDRCSKV